MFYKGLGVQKDTQLAKTMDYNDQKSCFCYQKTLSGP